MKRHEKKDVDNEPDITNIKTIKKNKFVEKLISVFNEHKGIIITVGNVFLFFISILVSSFSGSNIPFLLRVRTIIIIALVIYVCLSPVLIMHTIKCLRRFIVDEEIEEKNAKLTEKLCELEKSLQKSTTKLDKSIEQSEYYFNEIIIPHIADCSKTGNLVKKSFMINDIDLYYKKLIEARKNTNGKDVFLSNFSTGNYENENKNRKEYYSADIEFIKHIECKVYRIVTVHSSEKLFFLRKLVEDAEKSESVKYHLAYLDIEEFSDDKLPDIIGMDIIGDEVIIMDFRYARALRKNNNFNDPLYIESEEIANMCRNYYQMIWNDMSDEFPATKRRYQGYILYNGSLKRVNKNIAKIWKEIENKIPDKNRCVQT